MINIAKDNESRFLNPIRDYAEIAQFGILGALPFAALTGNVAADVSLILTCAIFLSTYKGSIKHILNNHFIRMSFLFWIWILVASAISLWPMQSFQDSLPWIRFPLYAFSLSMLLIDTRGRRLQVFLVAASLATCMELGVLFIEYLYFRSTETSRLYGTFSKLIPGWYLSCFGLISVLLIIEKYLTHNVTPQFVFLSVFYIILCSIGIVLTGEIMMTIYFFGALILFLSAYVIKKPKIFLLALTLIFFIVLILMFDDPLRLRIFVALEKRIPWYESSDYYPAWKMGLMTFLENAPLGVGPKNINLYCESLKETGSLVQTLGLKHCLWHPHNLFLQIAAETGIVGLILFIGLASYLVTQGIRVKWAGGSAIPASLLIISFFPIQTFSQAFGQSKNFFFWTIIGVSLALIYRHEENKNLSN